MVSYGIPLQELVRAASSRKRSNQDPRLNYGLQKRYIIDPANLCISQCEVSSLLFCLSICSEGKVLALHSPFKKYGTSMYIVDLTEYIFTQIIKGVNFFPIAESIASMHLGCYMKHTSDVNAANFNNTMKLHSQLFSMISGMRFAVPEHYKAS